MSTTLTKSTAPAGSPPPPENQDKANPAKVAIGFIGAVLLCWAIGNAFLAIGYYPDAMPKILQAIVAIILGVGGAAGLFFLVNMFIEGLPGKLSRGIMPYAYILPAFGLISLMLLYPTIQTINYSFANDNSTEYVGLENYKTIFSDREFWTSIINNVLWLLIVPAVTVALGVVVAVIADKLSAKGESIAKSMIFLPMAISFVGASTIWGILVYAYKDNNEAQTGMLNAVWKTLGGTSKAWLQISDGRLNTLLLMVILVWMQTGFAMVLLSSAIKGVPEETLEAARLDGANELQIFFQVVIPQIWGTIVSVFITIVILVLKVFDIVYVLTNGAYETNVIANLFFNKMFADSQAGVASAIVVILLIAITPVLIYQVRHFRKEEMNR